MLGSPNPNQKTQLKRHISQLKSLLAKYGVTPVVLVGTILRAWTAQVSPKMSSSTLPVSPKLLAEPLVARFVERLAGHSLLESAYWLSSAFTLLGDEQERQRLATYFTPPSITKCLLDELAGEGVDFGTQAFFDPACGGAAFLAPIAVRMRDALRAKSVPEAEILKHIENHLFGTDVEPTLCALSRHFLQMVLIDEIAACGRVPTLRVQCADSLTKLTDMFGQVDVVVCNPPYRKMKADEVARLRPAYDEVIEAQPNLYSIFLALSIRLLREGGVAALVTPTSFLSGRNFTLLRAYLIAQTQVRSIGIVSDRKGVYIDVEQETALTLVRRTCTEGERLGPTRVSVVASDGAYRAVGLSTLPAAGTLWPIPRMEGDAALLRVIGASPFRLTDYGVTARIGAYVWNRDTRLNYFSLKQARVERARTAVPLLWSSDVRADGKLHFTEKKKVNGEPNFIDYGSREHTSVIRRASVLLQRVTSNDMPRRLVGAAVPKALIERYGGFAGENHTVILEQHAPDAPLSSATLAAVLACDSIDRAFRCISGSTNVSTYELGQLPLPDPQVLAKLLARGMDIDRAVRHAFEATAEALQSA